MSRRGYLFGVAGLVGGLLLLFLQPGEEYFFGDSISVLWGRPHSWGSLLKDFTRLDGGFWFRPLSNSLPAFLLWPLFGMNFFPYHLVALALHATVSLLIFTLFCRMFRDHAAAFVGAAFFAFHPIQFYATYDLAFYQEPIMAGLALSALVLLARYEAEQSPLSLAAGLLFFVAALCAKETAVVLPGALLLVLWDRRHNLNRRMAVAVASTAAASLVFTLYYARVMGAAFRYQSDYRPRWGFQILQNAWLALRWAFGLAAGWQTQGWQYPVALQAVLWATLLGAVSLALFLPRTGVWRGLAWFLGAGLPAFSTNHLLPHHLYFPLVGVAFLVGGAVAWLRAADREGAGVRHWIASLAGTTAIATLFVAALVAARFDSVNSWVGRSAWEARSVAQFARAARLRLADARGLLVSVGKAPHLTFDWMSGQIFNLLGHDDLEIRLVRDLPPERPEGFYLLAYRDHWLWDLTPKQPGGFRGTFVRAARSVPALRLSLEPARVRAGADSYCLEIPALRSQSIDLKYRFNQRPTQVAYQFAHLDERGTACISVPASVPWGTVDVVAVRPSGSLAWSPVEARVEVLP